MRLRKSDDGLLEEWDVDARTPRAPRYAVCLPLAVRAEDDTTWRDGLIANASRTGILFVADVAWPLETPLEMRFHLGAGAREVESTVICKAVVTRSTPAPAAGGRAAMAAKISAYRFVGDSDGAAATVEVIGSGATP